MWRKAHRLQLRGQPRRRTAFPIVFPPSSHGWKNHPPRRIRAAAHPVKGADLTDLTLVLGGARSGKSRYAESLFDSGRRTYIATGQAFDDEMRQRIAAHRAARTDWTTIEEPLDLPGALGTSSPVLVDCLTLWVSNLLLAGRSVDVDALRTALAARTARTVLVSNEVGLGIVPDNALARRFRDEAGRLHQDLAAMADRVVLVVAGIPMRVK